MRVPAVLAVSAAVALWSAAWLGRAGGAGVPAGELPKDFPEGTKITVSGDTLGPVLDQISAQSKIAFHFHPNGAGAGVDLVGPKMEVNLKDVPLWEAIRQLQDGVQGAGFVEWRAAPAPVGSAVGEPFSNAGAFVLRVVNVIHNVDYGRTEPDLFYAGVLPMSDLSTRIVAVRRASIPTRAIDDAGNSLVPQKEPTPAWDMVQERGGGGRQGISAVQVMLQRAPNAQKAGQVLKRLEGELPVLIATKIDSFIVPFGTAEQRQYAGATAQIKFQTMTGGPGRGETLGEFAVTFERPGGMPDEDWARMAAAFSGTRMRQISASGSETTTSTGGENTSDQRRTTSVIYPIPANGDKPTIRVEIPAEWREVRIPYRFDNVPLP